MNKQEQRIIQAARKVLDNWLYGEINADVSGDFNELEITFKDYENPSPMDFDWQSFKAEAAKDILCAIIGDVMQTNNGAELIGQTIECSVIIADKLIAKLKEKEEK